MIPLAPYLHEFQKGSVHDNPNHGLDLELKQMAQRYFERAYRQQRRVQRGIRKVLAITGINLADKVDI